MARKVDEELRPAEIEIKRFIGYQYSEAKKLGYPTQSTFAKNIGKGDIGVPPPTVVDPDMDCIGMFFWGLKDIDRRILAERYLETGTQYEQARRCGLSIDNFNRKVNRILVECKSWLRCAAAMKQRNAA
jgi:hypothetical protein